MPQPFSGGVPFASLAAARAAHSLSAIHVRGSDRLVVTGGGCRITLGVERMPGSPDGPFGIASKAAFRVIEAHYVNPGLAVRSTGVK